MGVFPSAIWPVLLLSAPILHSEVPPYRAVSIDKTGQLHITAASGKDLLPMKLPGQTSFSQTGIAPDGRTVGWFAMYPDAAISYYQGAELAFKLVVFRGGRILHVFDTDQCFWDWQFQDGGKRVAYSAGPTHGGAAECVLRDVSTGREIAHWLVVPDQGPPDWAKTLRQ